MLELGEGSSIFEEIKKMNTTFKRQKVSEIWGKKLHITPYEELNILHVCSLGISLQKQH